MAMTFKVSKITGSPSYDSLPVAKVVTYPLEKRDYRPFAQNILCVSDTHLHLRMWAFEVNPSAMSRLEAVLYIFEDAPDTALAIVAIPASQSFDGGGDIIGCCLLKNGAEVPVSAEMEQKLQSIVLHPHNGEDLQGVYWGYTIDIPLTLLEEWGGRTRLHSGSSFPGNFYKICAEQPYIHYGCFVKADFEDNPYLPGSMGDFEVVTY